MYPFLDDIFNPRLREGGDGKANKTEIKDIIFNPRLREGGDKYPRGLHRLMIMVFNPRLREGGDINICCSISTPVVFNPRLREGGDSGNFDLNVLYKFSIHASAKEATEPSAKAEQNALFSIHASAKEATSRRSRAS